MDNTLCWDEFKGKKNNREQLKKKAIELFKIIHNSAVEIKNILSKEYIGLKDSIKSFESIIEIEFFLLNCIDRIAFYILNTKKRSIFMEELVQNMSNLYKLALQEATKGRIDMGDSYFKDYANHQIKYFQFLNMFPLEKGVFSNTGVSFLGKKVSKIIETKFSFKLTEELNNMIVGLIAAMNLKELLRG